MPAARPARSSRQCATTIFVFVVSMSSLTTCNARSALAEPSVAHTIVLNMTSSLRIGSILRRRGLRRIGRWPKRDRGFSAALDGCTLAWVEARSASHDRLRALLDAGLALTSELSLEAVLQRLVEAAAELTSARY